MCCGSPQCPGHKGRLTHVIRNKLICLIAVELFRVLDSKADVLHAVEASYQVFHGHQHQIT